MTFADFTESLRQDAPPVQLSPMLRALWWDAKGHWQHAHSLVDDLTSPEGMAVHAYLHRKEGDLGNADYWYRRAGAGFRRDSLDEEWAALVEGLLAST